jgi:antitoxin HicB
MRDFTYPIKLTPDPDGGFVVQFVDFDEGITQGEDLEDALAEAEDCLEEVIANRIQLRLDIPAPSKPRKGQETVSLNTTFAFKAALYLAMRQHRMTNVRLARKMDCDEKEIRRLLDPYYRTKIPRMEEALQVMGHQVNVRVKGI